MRAHLVGAAAAALLLAGAGQGQAQEIVGPGGQIVPQVSVTGQGEARARPDRAMITIGVQSRAATASAAAAENARIQQAVLDTLRALGIASEQLTTSNYVVHPEMHYEPDGRRPRVTGYVVSNTVRVDVRRLELASRVIDASLAKGANQIHGLDFYLADPAPARQAAIANAVSRARVDAEALARAAGGSLGRVLELTTAAQQPSPVFRQALRVEADMAGASTPIEAGEEVVRVFVTVRWQFVGG